jgi:hypothetical protein
MAKMITFTIPMAPLSVNNSQRSTRTGRRYKIPKAVEWEINVKSHILKQALEISSFVSEFDQFRHEIILNAFFYIDEKKYYVKEGGKKRVSKTIGDTFNMIKHLEDVIFKTIGLNDAFVRGGDIMRLPTKGTPTMVISLSFSDQSPAFAG